jgi:hypothetical protein
MKNKIIYYMKFNNYKQILLIIKIVYIILYFS